MPSRWLPGCGQQSVFRILAPATPENPPRPDTVKSCETELRKLLGDYEKNGYDVSKLVLNIHHALRNAELLERESIDPLADAPGHTGTSPRKEVRSTAGMTERKDDEASTRLPNAPSIMGIPYPYPYPFTAPAVNPEINERMVKKKRTTMGSAAPTHRRPSRRRVRAAGSR